METVPVLTITFFKMKSEVPFLGEAWVTSVVQVQSYNKSRVLNRMHEIQQTCQQPST
jgi:hypothetical protein